MAEHFFAGYRCSFCGAEYGPEEELYNCPRHGGNLDILLDTDRIRRTIRPEDIRSSQERSLWRYLPLLPVPSPGGLETPLWAAGGTPTYFLPALASQLGLQHFWVKDESRNPTGSFKDRASAIVIARARQIETDIIITASSGNAGAALAGMAAAAGQPTIILVPKNAPPAKIAQLQVFGAKVILVNGSYDTAFDLSLRGTLKFGWYSRNTGFNPFTAEGKKTAAFEIWEWWQKMTARHPSLQGRDLSIFVSVGDGNIISGIHKGFRDLVALGWLEKIPRLFGVQAEGAAAIVRAFEAGNEQIPRVRARTIADSISVGLPRDGIRALRAATQTGGAYLAVSDHEILQAIPQLGRVGVFAEPAGAAAYAGLVKAVANGILGPEDPVLVINTGNGLKDVQAAQKATGQPPVIEPSLRALKTALGM